MFLISPGIATVIIVQKRQKQGCLVSEGLASLNVSVINFYEVYLFKYIH